MSRIKDWLNLAKRFKIYARYKNYCGYILATLAITGGAMIAFGSGMVAGSFDNKVLAFFVTMIPLFLLWMLLKHEVEKGRSFVEAMRIMALITPSFLLCLWAFLTVVPVKYFSGQSLFGEEGSDYLALPQG